MSTLVQNVAKVKSAHAALSAAIEAKGVSVPAGTKLTGMPALVNQIQTGGGGGQDYGYLTFTAVEATTLALNPSGGIAPLKLLKSNDAVTWTKWENPSTNGISLNAGESVYIKADEDASQRTAAGIYDYNSFQSNGSIKCYGDIRSLVKLVAPADYNSFTCSLFKDCTSLTQAPELPVITLPNGCYNSMFQNCTSLIQAPELPATTLAQNCYDSMFKNCTSLKRIKMNASSGNWGQNMFNGCTSLELVDMTGSTGVPQLANVNNFANTNDTYKIVVPDSLYDTWIAATNWASIATHIMKQSDWNASHPDDQL